MKTSEKGKVLILGAGPSAVFSYFGCLDAGVPWYEVRIEAESFSQPPGAFWLRESPIPWEKINIPITLVGSKEGYSWKQWGMEVETSADSYFPGGVNSNNSHGRMAFEWGYDPTILLPTLYSMMPVRVGIRHNSDSLRDLCSKFEAVIITFPLDRSKPIIKVPVLHFPEIRSSFSCVYGGLESIPWVRQTTSPSGLFQEYPYYTEEKEMEEFRIEQERIQGKYSTYRRIVELPLGTEPLQGNDLRPYPNCLMVGRMATRNRKTLSHDARNQVRDFLGEVLS